MLQLQLHYSQLCDGEYHFKDTNMLELISNFESLNYLIKVCSALVCDMLPYFITESQATGVCASRHGC